MTLNARHDEEGAVRLEELIAILNESRLKAARGEFEEELTLEECKAQDDRLRAMFGKRHG